MNVITAAARALAVILAIASAFITAPLIPALLLILGGIAAAIGTVVLTVATPSIRRFRLNAQPDPVDA